MYPTPEIALDALTAVYQEMRADAERYAQRPDGNSIVIDRLDARLRQFNDAVRTLQAVGWPALWGDVDQKIKALQSADPSLDGIIVHLFFTPRGTRNALLNYCLYGD